MKSIVPARKPVNYDYHGKRKQVRTRHPWKNQVINDVKQLWAETKDCTSKIKVREEI